MKMLFNNKGISLVVLLIAITLISVLGASFVSLMGSKQKSFLHQVDSYRALNIANAGVEYAIRFASEPPDNINDSIFFSNPTLTTIGKSFGEGAFSVSYAYNQAIANDVLNVTGTYKGSLREVRLRRFRRYISPITLVPDSTPANRPRINGNNTIVPVISNNEAAFDVTRIDVTVNASNIYLTIEHDGINVFDYDTSPYPVCEPTPVPVCKDLTYGVLLGTDTIRLDLLLPNNHNTDSLSTYTFRFSGPAPTGRCTVDFYTSLSADKPFRIQFSL